MYCHPFRLQCVNTVPGTMLAMPLPANKQMDVTAPVALCLVVLGCRLRSLV